MPTPVSITGTREFSTTERISPAPPRGIEHVQIAGEAHHLHRGGARGVAHELQAALRQAGRCGRPRPCSPEWRSCCGWPPCRRAESRRCPPSGTAPRRPPSRSGALHRSCPPRPAARARGGCASRSAARRRFTTLADRVGLRGHLPHALRHGGDARFRRAPAGPASSRASRFARAASRSSRFASRICSVRASSASAIARSALSLRAPAQARNARPPSPFLPFSAVPS